MSEASEPCKRLQVWTTTELTPHSFVWLARRKKDTINGLYTDSINFNIEKGDGGSGTRVHAFSISEIAGALGDHGQNHWNIVQLMDSMGFEEYSHLDGSCPEP